MTREEAIKIIESNCSCSGSKLREACAMFIPELAESEDERIRKALIHLINEQDGFLTAINGISVKDIIAYLEKQKEKPMSATEVLARAGLKPYKDGNQWCILAGDNIQEGICGFGDTIDEALYQFLMEILEKQKDASKAMEAVERIDKYIDAHTANAHDMEDSNPDKKYYQGQDDALGKIAGILQDVYSNENQKKQKPKPYFYCKYGGTIPLCSDCKRNHYNSSFKTEEITTWYAPSNGTKHCIDYVQKEQKPILEVFGFKVGDAVRLKDGDGRKHIIKAFEEIEGIHGPNFYHVEFEDNSARDGIYPGEEYPNGYCTQMEKLDKQKEQKPIKVYDNMDDLIADAMIDEIGKSDIPDSAKHNRIYWINKHRQKPAEWSKEDRRMIEDLIRACHGWAMGTIEILPSVALEYEERLKSLRPQPKKELSIEKAIQWLDDTFYFLDNSSGRGKDCEITTHDFDSLEEMYDSFRKAVTVDSEPSWKPSEEQMEAFSQIVQQFKPDKELESLYEDLQKRYGTS